MDSDCDFCKYEEKCGLYESNCVYKHIFGKSEEQLTENKKVVDDVIANLKSSVDKLTNLNVNYDFDDSINQLQNGILGLEDMYSDELIEAYNKLIEE